MTPEQRLDRVENILTSCIRAGRRAREEWNYKINSLIDAQIRNEAAWRAESHVVNEQISTLIHTQMETTQQIKGLAIGQSELEESQKLTDRALRAFIDSLRKGGNGNSST